LNIPTTRIRRTVRDVQTTDADDVVHLIAPFTPFYWQFCCTRVTAWLVMSDSLSPVSVCTWFLPHDDDPNS